MGARRSVIRFLVTSCSGFPVLAACSGTGQPNTSGSLSSPPPWRRAAARALTSWSTLWGRAGFAVQRVADMDGWLAYHAAFVACIAAALYRCGTDPSRLAADRATLSLMCAAVTERFAALRRAGVCGLPRNLAILHAPLLRMVAVRYWARTMRSPTGELCFAAHSRHAQAEMRDLAAHLVERVGNAPGTGNLRRLLSPAPQDEGRP